MQGISREYANAVTVTMGEFEKAHQGNTEEMDWKKTKPFYTNISNDVDTQKKRIGGNFAIAQAVPSRELRDHIRLTLPDCIFITLTVTKENQKKRILARHGDNCSDIIELFNKFYEMYEGPGDGEENTYNIDITENMTPNDVMDQVLEILDKHCK